MNEFIAIGGGVLARLLATLDGFKVTYDYWPSTISLESGSLSSLVTQHLTPAGLFILQHRIKLTEGPPGDVVAYGNGRDSFSYSHDLEETEIEEPAALEWLGFETRR